MTRTKSSKKLILFIRLLVSISILLYLFLVIDWNQSFLVLSEIKLRYACLGPFFLLLGLYFAAIRWSWLLVYFDVIISKIESFTYYLIASFYSIILPGVLGGDIVRVGICSLKQKKSVTYIATSALLERVLGIVAIFSIGTISILLLSPEWQTQLGISLVMILPTIEICLVFGLLLIWLIVRFIPTKWFDLINQKIKFISQLTHVIVQLQKIPLRVLFGVAVLSVLFQSCDIIASYFLAQAISIKLPFLIFLVIIPLTYIATVLPISLGGLGVREGVLAFFLTRLSIETSDAVTYSFILYLNRIFIGIVGGMLQLIWKRFS